MKKALLLLLIFSSCARVDSHIQRAEINTQVQQDPFQTVLESFSEHANK